MNPPANVRSTGVDTDGEPNKDSYFPVQMETVERSQEEEDRNHGEALANVLQEVRSREDMDDIDRPTFSLNYGRAKATNTPEPAEDKSRPYVQLLEPRTPDGSVSPSVPDDTPSVQGSIRSTVSGSLPASGLSPRPSPSPSGRPFEWRFQARTSSGASIPRLNSPAFLTTHSRSASLSSQLGHSDVAALDTEKPDPDEEEEQKAWEAVRWSKLQKISSQAYSEVSKRTFGVPTFLTVAASIVVGTRKGLILVFDYQQNLKHIIGQGTLAAESGSITSLAVSADHTTIAAGHANGSIFTWEISRSVKPFLHIPPISRAHLQDRTGDGHISESAVLHISFLGQRRTALVSADEGGMAFSHLATRGLGAVARIVKTTRILGRYPSTQPESGTSRKPSSVLALSALPLGNVERSTDAFGLTAILTPFLLVIVSTMPVAQTQFKQPREKGLAAHPPMTGGLAWFPAVKLKTRSSTSGSKTSLTKLAYCWSNVLSVIEVDEFYDGEAYEPEKKPLDPEKRPTFEFRTRNRWTCGEAILTIQWLSRSIIAVLTVTQRLLILDDQSMRIADSSDLVAKHVFHQDLFSRQLQPLVEKFEQEDTSMHGVVPDAYYMSLKAYKSRLFLLGFSDLSMGTLSNWADRLNSLMASGKCITAIELATAYYNGAVDRVTIGLPEDNTARRILVKQKLLELISASIKQIFRDDDDVETDRNLHQELQRLAPVAFTACLSIDAVDVLFDELYESYSDASMQDIFFYTLEPYIVDGTITSVPTLAFKDLLNWFSSYGYRERLEIIICALDTNTMDIDQVASICRQNQLYDGLIYVWTRGLSDYVTPLIDLLFVVLRGDNLNSVTTTSLELDVDAGTKLFTYLAYTLTGRQYPGDAELQEEGASKAKACVYSFLFSHTIIKWPKPRGKLVRTGRPEMDEATYPYLRLLLHFDAYNFLSMLNEAFEDSFLNGVQTQMTNGASTSDLSERSFGYSVNRQRIVNILLETMASTDFDQVSRLYLDIFIARNIAKFAQFILLPENALHRILVELCHYPSDDLLDECQLSVEYLLTMFHPPSIEELVSLLEDAKFYRVLKGAYRANRQFSKWLETFFDDPDDRSEIFACISDCLRPDAGLNPRQLRDVKSVLIAHAKMLTDINPVRTTDTLCMYAPDLLDSIYQKLDDDSRVQYLFLKSIFTPNTPETDTVPHVRDFAHKYQEQYVKLMCQQEPEHVLAFVNTVSTGDLKLDRVLPVIERSGAIDAAVTLLARDGLGRDAMDRLMKHLGTLKTALTGLLDAGTDSPDLSNSEEATKDLLSAIDKYVKLGIWLCRSHTRSVPSITLSKRQRKKTMVEMTEEDLSVEETFWLDLIDAIVTISRAVSPSNDETQHDDLATRSKASETLRLIVQEAFTALLASTSSVSAAAAAATGDVSRQQQKQDSQVTSPLTPNTPTNMRLQTRKEQQDHRFLHILRAFLRRTSLTTPTLSDLRRVLTTIFSAYAFEASMLGLANAFLEKDVWAYVADADQARRQGWRPSYQSCAACRKRAWGPGVGGGVWEEWQLGQDEKTARRRAKWGIKTQGDGNGHEDVVVGKGKGRAVHLRGISEASASANHKARFNNDEQSHDRIDQYKDKHEFVGGSTPANTALVPTPVSMQPQSLVVFACSHVYHRPCLEIAMKEHGLSLALHESHYSGSHYADHHGHGIARAGSHGSGGFICPICAEERLKVEGLR